MCVCERKRKSEDGVVWGGGRGWWLMASELKDAYF